MSCRVNVVYHEIVSEEEEITMLVKRGVYTAALLLHVPQRSSCSDDHG